MAGRARRASSFIEVLLSLVLLAVAGTALVTLLGQTVHSIENLKESERQTRAAGVELSALAVLDRQALIAHVGTTHPHGWTMQITRTSNTLFDVSVAASDTTIVLVRTTLYRPDTAANATP